MTPKYELIVESTTLSNVGESQNLLSSLTVTDKLGPVADTLDFTLAYDGSFQLPPTKGQCEIKLGYEGTLLPPGIQAGLWNVGTFIVEEVVFDSSRRNGKTMSVRAISMPASPETGRSLQNSTTRQWQSYELKETTFATIVNEVCRGAGLTATIDSDLASIEMPFTAQVGKTDAAFLTEIAAIRDAQVKYSGQTVIIIKKDKSTLPTIQIAANGNITDYQHSVSSRSDIKQVDATYRDADNSVKVISVGSGAPKLVIDRLFPTEAVATDAAKSLLAHIQRDTEKLSLTLPTVPNLRAESPVELSGFEGNTDGLYICYEISHRFDSGGLISTIQAKKRVEA